MPPPSVCPSAHGLGDEVNRQRCESRELTSHWEGGGGVPYLCASSSYTALEGLARERTEIMRGTHTQRERERETERERERDRQTDR